MFYFMILENNIQPNVFRYFQGVYISNIGQKWVKIWDILVCYRINTGFLLALHLSLSSRYAISFLSRVDTLTILFLRSFTRLVKS